MSPEPDNPAAHDQVIRALEAARPIPDPTFRGELRRSLLARAPGLSRPLERATVMRQILAFAGSGAALLVIAAVGLAGVGPFAA